MLVDKAISIPKVERFVSHYRKCFVDKSRANAVIPKVIGYADVSLAYDFHAHRRMGSLRVYYTSNKRFKRNWIVPIGGRLIISRDPVFCLRKI